MTHTLPPQLQFTDNLLLDFGPRLPYPQLGTAYTVPKMALWLHTTEHIFETVQLRASEMHKARLEGTLYYITDEDDIRTLDNKRQVGVCCDRKHISILLPYRNSIGQMIQSKAHVYVGRPGYWEDRIEYDQIIGRSGNRFVDGGRSFQMASLVPDADRLLNNRFAFDPPPYYTHPERDVTPEMAEHVGRKNREAIEAINRRLAADMLRRQMEDDALTRAKRKKEFLPKLMRIITRRE